MRRSEFAMEEQEELARFLEEMSFGVLGTLGDDGYPELTPINFVYYENSLFFHGSRVGQKMRNLAARPQVTFSVAKEYAIVPSYFSNDKLACPATAYFKSVIIKGEAEIVSDLAGKAAALGAFMRKLQPEGGYAPIDPADPDYAPQLKATSIVRIRIHEMTGKFKFGQNLREEPFRKVTDGLERRGRELDADTVRLMRMYCPHHKSPGSGRS